MVLTDMSFWNYIGEFFLFRWLFGSHRHNETKRNLSDTTTNFDNRGIIDDNDSHIGYGSRYDNQCYDYSQSYDDFHDEHDYYDMTDDDF